MFRGLMKDLKCTICENGDLYYEPKETVEAYTNIFELDDIDKIVNGVIENYLVFKCVECSAIQRLTYKDIELAMRQTLSKKVMTAKATGEITNAINFKPRYYIFCSKCTGFDGKGSCPPHVYNDCSLRRIPNVL